MMEVMRLNRDELIGFRLRRARIADRIARCTAALQQVPRDASTRVLLQDILAELEMELNSIRNGSPWNG